jgi:hypothetical protein
MSTLNVSAPEPGDGNGFLAQLLPNRGRARSPSIYADIPCRWRAWGAESDLGCVRGLTCASYLGGCGLRSNLSQSEKFKRDSGVNIRDRNRIDYG